MYIPGRDARMTARNYLLFDTVGIRSLSVSCGPIATRERFAVYRPEIGLRATAVNFVEGP